MKCKDAMARRAAVHSLLSSIVLVAFVTALTVSAAAQTTATITPINYGAAVGILQAGDQNFYAPSQPIRVSCTADSTSLCSFIYKMKPDGTVSVFYAFPPVSASASPAINDTGIEPTALIVGTDGNLYGACLEGGPGGGGTIFKMDLAGNPPTVLASFAFNGRDPVEPRGLIQGSDGNLYFVNFNGVFKLTLGASGATLSNVVTFPFLNQILPLGAGATSLIEGSDGNFYLTLSTGQQTGPGTAMQGAIAQVTPSGVLAVLHTLKADGSEGNNPLGPLTQGPDGTLYGITLSSGANSSGPALIFSITPGGVYTVLHQADAAKIGARNGALFLASDGNLYGTTLIGGDTASANCKPLGCGTFYQLTTATPAVYTDLHDFEGGAASAQNPPLPPVIGGAGPTTPLVQADGGIFFGTQLGGAASTPTVYKAELTPAIPSPIQLTFDPSPAIPGEPTTLTWKVLNAFSLTAQQCSASIVGSPSGAGNWTGLQTGTLSNGVYSGTAQITPTANGLFTYALTCGGKESGFTTLTVNKDGALKIVTTTDALPQGTVSKQYDSVVTAAGGFGTYQWSIIDGQLPPGITFDETSGALAGVPTQWGSYPMTFKVVDESKPQESASQSITMVVKSGLTLIPNLPNPLFNTSYSISLVPDTTGGLPQYTWNVTSGKLPTGLTLDSSTGLISGKSTEAGSFTFTITVTDSEDNPDKAQATVTLKVAGPLQINMQPTLPAAAVGEPYTVALLATGGIPPYSWDFGQNAAGAVPPGMNLAQDGTFSGTPTQYSLAADGFNRFNVVVSDSSTPPQQIPATFAIAINSTLKIETTALPNGTIGVVADVPLEASGGIPPYTWSASISPNPNIGVQVNGTNLEYNPTVAGNSLVVLTVQDSERIPDSKHSESPLSLIIVPLQLQTTTVLTTSNATPGAGQTVVFTTKVTQSQGTVTPTGQVTFFNGPTILGIAPLGANGIATFQTSFAAPGVYSITAAYGGSGTYAPSTSSPLTETVVTAGVSAVVRPASLTLQPGGIGLLVINVTPFGGYTGTVSFACGTLPANVSCAFLPQNLRITAGGGARVAALLVTTGRRPRRVPPAGTYTIPITMTVPGETSQNLSATLVVQ